MARHAARPARGGTPRVGPRVGPRVAVAVALLAGLGTIASLVTTAEAATEATTPPAAQVQTLRTTSASTTLARTAISDGGVGRLWTSIGRTPSLSEIDRLAPRYDVIILNAWNTAQLARIRQVNPRALVLVYKCLSSTRSYTTDRLVPAGVRYQDAQDGWFATSTTGQRIEWGTYPGHWQMATWDRAYQAAWVGSVTREVVDNGWDGVMADNDLQTLRWYSSARVAGTTSADQSDAKIRAGLGELVDAAGASLNEAGKLLVPNVSDGRLDLGRWDSRSRWGGALEENFARWGSTPGEGYLTDWGSTGWVDQTRQLRAPITLAITSTSNGDDQALRYGFASAAIRAAGRVAWQPHAVVDYSQPERFAWQDVDLGAPGAVSTARGTWSREFAKAWLVVNPSTAAQSVTVPARYGGGTTSVPARDARMVMATEPAPTTPAPTTPAPTTPAPTTPAPTTPAPTTPAPTKPPVVTVPTPKPPVVTVPRRPHVKPSPVRHRSRVVVIGSRQVRGTSARLTVRVRSARTPSGVVEVRRAGRVIGTASLDGRGRARIDLGRLRTGRMKVRLVYRGDAAVRGDQSVVLLRSRR